VQLLGTYTTLIIFRQSPKRGISIQRKDNPRHNSFQIHKLKGTDFGEFYIEKGIDVFLNKNVM